MVGNRRMKVVIPAAGLGTRFLPYTRSQPKEMLPIVDKPAIQYVIEEAVQSGLSEILIITARGKRAIEDHFDRNLGLEHDQPSSAMREMQVFAELLDQVRIYYIRQKDHRGLGHAVLTAEEFVNDEPFSVMLGDDLTFGQSPCQRALLDVHVKRSASVIAVQHVEREVIGRYGMVVGKEEGDGLFKVEEIIEKPKPDEASSTLATLGRYVFTPGIFSHLRKTTPDERGEVQLTDAIESLLKQEDVYAFRFDGRRYDVGDKVGWLRANVELAAKRPDLSEAVRRMLEEFANSR